jgi:hypothetical protein
MIPSRETKLQSRWLWSGLMQGRRASKGKEPKEAHEQNYFFDVDAPAILKRATGNEEII